MFRKFYYWFLRIGFTLILLDVSFAIGIILVAWYYGDKIW